MKFKKYLFDKKNTQISLVQNILNRLQSVLQVFPMEMSMLVHNYLDLPNDLIEKFWKEGDRYSVNFKIWNQFYFGNSSLNSQIEAKYQCEFKDLFE